MKSGDLVRLLRRFINTHTGQGDLGLLIDVLPGSVENPMGWTDHTHFTHRVYAGGEVRLYRAKDLEPVQ